MDFSFNGQPFVHVASKGSILLSGADYAQSGQPFVSNDTSGYANAVNGISGGSIAYVNNISTSAISKINNV